MAVISFGCFDDEVVCENRVGQDRDFLPDPLGSTMALLDASQSKTDIWFYWPYGEERARTGTTPTPFQFVGTLGYYKDSAARVYVRARSYRTGLAMWMTVDPLWPDESAYAYVEHNPVTWQDPTGRAINGALTGGQLGAEGGAIFGPWGAVIGGILGAVAGGCATGALINAVARSGRNWEISIPQTRKDCNDLYKQYKKICPRRPPGGRSQGGYQCDYSMDCPLLISKAKAFSTCSALRTVWLSYCPGILGPTATPTTGKLWEPIGAAADSLTCFVIAQEKNCFPPPAPPSAVQPGRNHGRPDTTNKLIE